MPKQQSFNYRAMATAMVVCALALGILMIGSARVANAYVVCRSCVGGGGGSASLTMAASPTVIANGQSSTLTATWEGIGTGTPILQWISGSSATCTSDSQLGSPTSAPSSVATLPVSPTSSTYYCYSLTMINSPVYYSNTVMVTVLPPCESFSMSAPAGGTATALCMPEHANYILSGTFGNNVAPGKFYNVESVSVSSQGSNVGSLIAPGQCSSASENIIVSVNTPLTVKMILYTSNGISGACAQGGGTASLSVS